MDQQELTQAEIEAFRREHVLLDEVEATPDRYPRMFNLLTSRSGQRSRHAE